MPRILPTQLLKNMVLEMLDPGLCQQVAPERIWTKFSWTLVNLLSNPIIIYSVLAISVLGAIAAYPWIKRHHRLKKPAMFVGISLITLYVAIKSPLLAGLGNQLLVGAIPPDSGENADAIVVLGRGAINNPNRVEKAVALWQQQRAPLIFASGNGDAPLIVDLASKTVPKEAIAGEPCSLTTNQNAEFTAALLRPKGIRTIILVTDAPHMLRSFLTFKSFGFEVIPHISPLSPSLTRFRQRTLVFREGLGLLSYGLLGRYFSREVPPASVIYSEQPAHQTPSPQA